MTATLTYEGELSIGGLCPVVVSATSGAITDLQARVTGMVSLQARLTATPPSLASSITAVKAQLAQLQAALAGGSDIFPPPTAQIAALGAAVAALEASLGVFQQLEAIFGVGGVFAWTFEGTGPELGPALEGALAGGWPDGSLPTAPANAIVLATVSPATWTALQTFFGGL